MLSYTFFIDRVSRKKIFLMGDRKQYSYQFSRRIYRKLRANISTEPILQARNKPKWSSAIDMRYPATYLHMTKFFSSLSLCSVLLFLFIYGKQSQAFFKGRLEVISNLRSPQLIAILLRHFWFPAIARTRKAGACTVISRSFARLVDIVAWPVQR